LPRARAARARRGQRGRQAAMELFRELDGGGELDADEDDEALASGVQ
jgi:hypothetical protein